jgi:sterol desaturase/sphingolipid hydroxylase (fatty acid hydroxylase superfamily)
MKPMLDTVQTIADWAAILPFALLPFEIWRLRLARALDRRTWLEMAANLSPLVPMIAFYGLLAAFATGLYAAIQTVVPWRIETTPWTFAAALLAVDFLYYWDHRAGHRVRALWAASHSVHHSSPLFNQTTGLRISFVDGLITPWFYAPLIVVGFEPATVIAAYAVVLAWQQWIHTETIGKLGWLDRLLNTPSNHRVHHGTESWCIDRNYGGVLMVWDHLFGTYAAERAPTPYGLTTPIDSVNPIDVHCAEAVRFARDFAGLKTWRARLRFALGGPEQVVTDAPGRS